MPIATNPDTGDTVYLDDSGDWKPAKKAVNPDTKEVMAYDGKDWQKVTTHGHGILSYVDDAVRAIANGVTFGYADTIAAGANAAIGKGSYDKNLEQERQRTAQTPAGIRIPGEIAGGVLGAVAGAPVAGAMGAATGLSRLPAAAKIIAGGAAAGGAYASSEGTGLEDRLSRVPGGAVIGAATGGLFAGAGRVIGALRSPEEKAVAELQRAMGRDEVTPQSAGAVAKGLDKDRPGLATVADVGGENVRGLVERVAQTPGAGRTTVIPFLTQRQESQVDRIAGDLGELTGSQRTAKQAVDQTMKVRADEAAPLYRAAYEAGDKPIWGNELERLSAVPEVQEAMHGAVKGWQRSQIAQGYGAMNPGATVEGGGILKFLNGRVPVLPNIQFWDYTKSALDDMIGAEIRDDGTISRKGRDLTIIASKLRETLDAAVPEYAAARDSWGGHSSYLNAIKLGKGVMATKKSAEEAIAEFNTLSAADKQAYREGAVSSILAKMENDPAKLADMTKYLRSRGMRAKVAAIMPTPEAAQAWQRRLNFEVKSSELVGRSLGNSATARRLAEKEDAENMVGDLVLSAFKGVPSKGLMTQVIVGGAKKVRDTLRSRTDKELAQMLTGQKSVLRIQAPSRRLLGQSALIPSVGASGAESGLIQQ